MVACRSVVTSLSLGAVLAFGFVGDARAGKFSHEASVKPEVQLSERAKPPPRRDDAPAPPSADVLLAVEVVIEDVHLEQAELLRGLIARTPDENVDEKGEYYLRLGELFAKTQRLHRLKGAEDEIALGKATDPKRRAALAQSLAAHRAAERAALAATLETYRTLIENPRFASYPNLDTAVFGYAYTLQHAGPPKAKEALAAFGRLLKDFPWEDAARAFTEVVETGKLGPKLVQVSADAAMQAWMKALAVDPQRPGVVGDAAPPPADGKPPVPRPLPEREGKLLAAYDVYLTYVPDGADDERVGVLFLKADLLRRFDHLAEAIPLFEQIVAQHPDHEAAEDAAQLPGALPVRATRTGRCRTPCSFARAWATTSRRSPTPRSSSRCSGPSSRPRPPARCSRSWRSTRSRVISIASHITCGRTSTATARPAARIAA